MAAAGGGGHACAACKYQRRRCGAKCPLARYFPHDRPRVFRNAHRLFGVSNILKTLDRAGPDPGRRHEAMQCVVYESQAWDLYPSAGCVPIIVGLRNRIRQAEDELRRVQADLQAYRRAAAAAEAISSPPPPPFQLQWPAMAGDDEGGIAAAAPNNAAVTSNDDGSMAPPQYEHPFFVNATTMVPQFHYGQQQPILVSTQLPELQDDTMSYFADGINDGNDEMPRQSSMDTSGEKAMRNAPKLKGQQ